MYKLQAENERREWEAQRQLEAEIQQQMTKQEMQERIKENDERIHENRNQQEYENLLRKEIKNLKRKDRMEAAERVKRQQEYEREILMEKIMKDDLRVQKLLEEK